MKITVKTTQQKIFHVEIDPEKSIGDLKAKIEEDHGHPVAAQRIIFSGRILSNDKTVESYGIKEKDFLVLMVTKPKAQAAAPSTDATLAPAVTDAQPSVSTTPPTTTPETASDTTPGESTPASVDTPAPPPTTSAETTSPAFGSSVSFLTGEALQTTINNMVDMGFPRDQVLRALRASFNNPDRAVEYLMTGIPSFEAEPTAPAAAAPASVSATPAAVSATPAAAPATPAPAPQPANQPQNLFQLAQQQQQQQQAAGGPRTQHLGAGGLDLEALRNNPQIQQLRQLMEQNPALAQPLIQQIASNNPTIAQALAQNPEALLELFGAEGIDEDNMIPPGAQVISVTEEERAAIERLEALGFPRQAVIEAYLACDKNEELAANYLFENGFDD